MINKKQFTCTKNGRLDEILAEHLQLSRSQAQKYIKQGVEIDGKKISKSGCSIKEGQVVTFYSLEIKEEEKPDLDIVPYKTIYEDNDILVINKPRGLVVHPSAGHKNDTLVNYLVHHYKTLSKQMEDENTDRPGIIHRIDKDTSGLLVIAKTPKSYISLAEQVANHSIDREYICIVHGVPSNKKFKVDACLGRDPKDRKKEQLFQKNKENVQLHILHCFGQMENILFYLVNLKQEGPTKFVFIFLFSTFLLLEILCMELKVIKNCFQKANFSMPIKLLSIIQ